MIGSNVSITDIGDHLYSHVRVYIISGMIDTRQSPIRETCAAGTDRYQRNFRSTLLYYFYFFFSKLLRRNLYYKVIIEINIIFVSFLTVKHQDRAYYYSMDDGINKTIGRSDNNFSICSSI